MLMPGPPYERFLQGFCTTKQKTTSTESITCAVTGAAKAGNLLSILLMSSLPGYLKIN
jgi:hypothetical protein